MRGIRWARLLALMVAMTVMLTACGDAQDAADSSDAGTGDTAATGTETEGTGTETGATGTETATATETGGTETAGAEPTGGDVEGKIAVLLPDSASSSRWETDDRRFFEQAFEEAGLSSDQYTILNAEGDASTQQTQAEQAITDGARVLLLVNLDSGSGAAIVADAKSQDVSVIDYDRLTLDAESDYYVSFNNVTVGELQGQGLVDCITEAGVENPQIAVLNGSPTDNNATLFAQGYNSVLDPLFESGDWTEVDDQSVPDWDNQQALVIFEQMLTAANNEIDGVLAANDGLGNAAISALKSAGLNGIPVTGQDATVEGIQNILAGDQCMTVYKAIREEAFAAADLAVSLLQGEEPEGVEDVTDNGSREVPSLLLTPVAVTADNIEDTVIADEFRTWEEICVGEFEQYCPEGALDG